MDTERKFSAGENKSTHRGHMNMKKLDDETEEFQREWAICLGETWGGVAWLRRLSFSLARSRCVVCFARCDVVRIGVCAVEAPGKDHWGGGVFCVYEGMRA